LHDWVDVSIPATSVMAISYVLTVFEWSVATWLRL